MQTHHDPLVSPADWLFLSKTFLYLGQETKPAVFYWGMLDGYLMGCSQGLSLSWLPPAHKTNDSGLCVQLSHVESRGFMKLVLLCTPFPQGLSSEDS